MIDVLVGHWPYVLLAVLVLYIAGTVWLIARCGRPRPADRDRATVIIAGGGFRLADARADARARLGESTARANTRPTGGCDNVVPIRRPRRSSCDGGAA